MGIQITHFTTEARRWLNLVSRRILLGGCLHSEWGEGECGAQILGEWRWARLYRESGDIIMSCATPFDPLRVKRASGRLGSAAVASLPPLWFRCSSTIQAVLRPVLPPIFPTIVSS
ncbi:hypothetical protein HAX54_025116 [Datura stramonium]|uniref:Uncharacterized protein n=1 Tax=Datura stramonium TaxID=4076 RepID=A0ABS8S5U3_DATST|nr:hypothetical protein [Datura stramonium]